MTPLFTITTPNGQTIEGYELICGNFFTDIPIETKVKPYLISDITEEQAKEWGYENELSLHISRKDMLTIQIMTYLKDLPDDEKGINKYLSNILLIVIQTPEK